MATQLAAPLLSIYFVSAKRIGDEQRGDAVVPSALTPPINEAQLLERANALAGLHLREVADRFGVALPASNVHGKGLGGQLLEMALGAQAGAASIPDFPHLGIELKTVPIGSNGLPKESTHVCVVPLRPGPESQFKTSCVARKLARVLWMPMEAPSRLPLGERRIGQPHLWSPNPEQLDRIRTDFDELMDMVLLGGITEVNARLGEVLQIRPKAANAAEKARASDADGAPILTNP
ncbi:MAG: hypothetical protein HOI95_24365, partial [Chromatiales bacterium]|nr:hypothetical protein [Chromatiales bacterium]